MRDEHRAFVLLGLILVLNEGEAEHARELGDRLVIVADHGGDVGEGLGHRMSSAAHEPQVTVSSILVIAPSMSCGILAPSSSKESGDNIGIERIRSLASTAPTSISLKRS